MDKSISLQVKFRKSNKETGDFCNSFLNDFRLCINRFKINALVSDSQEVKSENFLLIFLSNQDLSDQQFLSEIISYSSSDKTILINLDPIKPTDFPLHKFKGFRFWDEIKETGETRLFRRSISENNAFYWEKITDITIEVSDRINIAGKEVKKGKVFLAQTDNSQSADRDNLKRDLEELGYNVLPDRLLSLDYNECTDQIKQQLKDCKLIIHSIPLVYSKYFTDKQVSLIEHQCNLSTNYINEKHKVDKRIIWIPSDLDISDEENQIFVEKIQRDQEQTQNTLVLKVTLEELKKIYRRILSGETIQTISNDLPDIYLVVDQDDTNIEEKFISAVAKTGLSVKSNFRGITYNQHLKYLANSQVVVINYTADNQPWFTMKVNDIYKSSGLASSKPFKKLILVKENSELNTSAFENRFSEVHVGSLKGLNLNLAVNNN